MVDSWPHNHVQKTRYTLSKFDSGSRLCANQWTVSFDLLRSCSKAGVSEFEFYGMLAATSAGLVPFSFKKKNNE